MINAMLQELEAQRNYLEGDLIETIYFGGGTPSLLEAADIRQLFDQINKWYKLSDKLEISIEANPDDLTSQKVDNLKKTPVNRFSIGIQSFFDVDLQFMNRAHHAAEATACIKRVQDAGFENLTIDLIYGSPTTPDDHWASNIEKAINFDIPHISCYCLTVEPNTALDHFVKKGMAQPVDEARAEKQFNYLIAQLNTHHFEHYEISNFAKNNCYSIHNTNYWRGEKYLGIGPSAHSFNGKSRQWNIANNAKYMTGLKKNHLHIEKEILTAEQQHNEYVMIALRTMWGINFSKIKELNVEKEFLKNISPLIKEQLIIEKNNHFILTKKGKFLADGIAAKLFL